MKKVLKNTIHLPSGELALPFSSAFIFSLAISFSLKKRGRGNKSVKDKQRKNEPM